jgi:hypothetical protein
MMTTARMASMTKRKAAVAAAGGEEKVLYNKTTR